MTYHRFIDPKTYWSTVAMLLMLMIAMYPTKGTGYLISVPFILMALIRRDSLKLFAWLLATIAVVVGNAALMPKNMIFAISQRSIFLLLSVIIVVQIGGSRLAPTMKCILPFMIYVLYMVLPSAAGWNPVISFLKLILFSSVFLAFFGAANGIVTAGRADGRKIRGVILAFISFYIIGSVMLLPFPGISQMLPSDFIGQTYNPNATSLFKGMTMHSQCMGPCAAGAGVFILADLLFSVRKWHWLYLSLFSCIVVVLYMTSSRTAAGSWLSGCAFVLYFFAKSRGVGSHWKGKVFSAAILVFCVVSVMLVASSSFQRSAVRFATKGVASDDHLEMEDVLVSRVGKYEEGMYWFRKSPVIGNGFQVGADMVRMKGRSIKDYLSAPVEKSVWISAVLEEGGICGFSIFILILLVIYVASMRCRAYIGLSVFLTLIISNLGEFTMFSMSYTGGFLWAMVFSGYAIDALRNRMPFVNVQRYNPGPYGWT